LQAQNQELEELNKELRQCNLQQFIQQTGATVTVGQARSEEDAQPELSPRELPACRRNGGQHAASAAACPAPPNLLVGLAPSSSLSGLLAAGFVAECDTGLGTGLVALPL